MYMYYTYLQDSCNLDDNRDVGELGVQRTMPSGERL